MKTTSKTTHKPLTLENETLRLDYSRQTGALIGLHAKPGNWALLDRPHLGLSFRLLVPLTSKDPVDKAFAKRMGRPQAQIRNNEVHGEQQKLASLTVAPDNQSAVFVWDNLTSTRGGKLPIKVTIRVELTARQAIYRMEIENRSQHTVENVYCPYFGDIQHPAGDEVFETCYFQYGSTAGGPLWPRFHNNRGYYGADHPIQYANNSGNGHPTAPFILLKTPTRGLYAGVLANSCEYLSWVAELRPGYESANEESVPVEKTMGGKEVSTRFAAVHMPYILPGVTRTITPIALEAYEGTWHKGVDIYTAWRKTWMKPAVAPAWAREPHAWLQLHINSPEDELRIRFKDLPKVGAECARHGVKAIQLVGWNDGGQDQGNPSHDPDPRLGTFDELKTAIRKIHAMGVKVILFAKFTWSDRSTADFRKDLVRMAVKDLYGDYHVYCGYQYQTATQLLDINTKRLVPMCMLSEEYLKLCEKEFQKTVDLGAAGILFDESQHHTPAVLCFDKNHGHRFGAPVYANDRLLIQRFAERLGQHAPEFIFAGEACYDWEMEAYNLSYYRSGWKGYTPWSRYMLPHSQLMTAICGFNDRNMVNQCLMCREIMSYEPYNFKGSLDDFPLTMAYGKKMDALRTELRDYFWDGEFRHTVGAKVTVDGKPHNTYSVFWNVRNGKAGLVIVNEEKTPITVKAKLDDGGKLARWRLVDAPKWKPTKAIVIPPRSAAVVV
ncbi:MAG: DUF6259 domain-containing protein [Kiritimatiellia bacterium]